MSVFFIGLRWAAGTEVPLSDSSRFPPHLPPIPDANAALREEREVLVPTAFEASRTEAVLVVRDDPGTLKPIKLMVGSKMILGMSSDLYIYPIGGARPTQPQRKSFSGPPQKDSKKGLYFYPKKDGVPQPGKPCIVELEIAIFETDIPAQHMWAPQSDKFKVLWRTTLRKIVEESAKLPDEIRSELEWIQQQPVLPAK